MSTAGPRADADERWRLSDQREFLERSLRDAEQEHAAGDLDPEDFELLQRRDRARLAEVEARLAALDAADSDRPAIIGTAATATATTATTGRPRRRFRRRAWMIVVGLAAVFAAAGILVSGLTSNRLPGQVSSGGVTLSGQALVTQQVHQAAVLVQQGHVTEALDLYQVVLGEDPAQPQALAEGGWLEWEAGSQAGNAALAARGRALVTRAVAVAPGLYAAHVYLGTIDLQLGHPATAVAQYRLFLADHPPGDSVQGAAADIRQAFADTGQPVPAGVPAPAATQPTG